MGSLPGDPLDVRGRQLEDENAPRLEVGYSRRGCGISRFTAALIYEPM
jgi:hypothetical protein